MNKSWKDEVDEDGSGNSRHQKWFDLVLICDRVQRHTKS